MHTTLKLLASMAVLSVLSIACSKRPPARLNAAADKAQASATAAVDATKDAAEHAKDAATSAVDATKDAAATAADQAKAKAGDIMQKAADKAQAAADSLKK